MSRELRVKKRKRNRKKKKMKFRPGILLLEILYIFVLCGVTAPIILFFGPYENTRKVLVSTLLATRHSYLLTNLLSQDTINKMLGENNDVPTSAQQTSQNTTEDLSKIQVKYKVGNDITKYKIHTTRYDGYALEIKNPLKIKVAMTKYLGKLGQKTSEMAMEHNAVAAINGGSFVDKSSDGVEYAGTGGEPGGFVISGGQLVYPKSGYNDKTIENVIAFTKGGTLIVGDHSLSELKKLDVQEAMCFRKPNIIINGVRQIKDKTTEGFNPRTSVGQKADGTVIFLALDGRKVLTPGASLYDVQEIMMERGAINAGALDGGYSTTMYYKGDVINSPNAWDGERSVATAFYVEG
ncbi:phosphodiester glycosidase family protein [Clostridium saccharobutylicum]|uniref:Phosphodiester glycosidase domain-containing protein n=1 Tax=Clostridium saccharobutylicum TaxID=169679 RepID=A0A1S8MYJ0_CLOSA|nr:phosphodiester glycosidase family protein [Clostridium saccharobutylicum]OOM09279.1 hypothetical protein CLOSAC_35600 [Clostridium saccharobutylicum]